jgi:hypothetical protein
MSMGNKRYPDVSCSLPVREPGACAGFGNLYQCFERVIRLLSLLRLVSDINHSLSGGRHGALLLLPFRACWLHDRVHAGRPFCFSERTWRCGCSTRFNARQEYAHAFPPFMRHTACDD